MCSNQNLIHFNKQLMDFLNNLKLLNIDRSKEIDIAILYLKKIIHSLQIS
jgi:hypothetical protein